jgi:hypothetical protein
VGLLRPIDRAEAGRDGDHGGVRRPDLPHLAQDERLACRALLEPAAHESPQLTACEVKVEAGDGPAPLGHGGAILAGGLNHQHRDLECQCAVTEGKQRNLEHIVQRYSAGLSRNDTALLLPLRQDKWGGRLAPQTS